MASYIALIRKERDSDFGVDFADFPGCVTAGATLEEARQMAQEVLELHVQGVVEDGETLPAASSLDTILNDPINQDAVAFLVTLPGSSERSAFLAQAAEKALSEG